MYMHTCKSCHVRWILSAAVSTTLGRYIHVHVCTDTDTPWTRQMMANLSTIFSTMVLLVAVIVVITISAIWRMAWYPKPGLGSGTRTKQFVTLVRMSYTPSDRKLLDREQPHDIHKHANDAKEQTHDVHKQAHDAQERAPDVHKQAHDAHNQASPINDEVNNDRGWVPAIQKVSDADGRVTDAHKTVNSAESEQERYIQPLKSRLSAEDRVLVEQTAREVAGRYSQSPDRDVHKQTQSKIDVWRRLPRRVSKTSQYGSNTRMQGSNRKNPPMSSRDTPPVSADEVPFEGRWEQELKSANPALANLHAESLFFEMNITSEERSAMSGGPHQGLKSYKSTCWPARLPHVSRLQGLYETNPYYFNKCVNGGDGQDHCRYDMQNLLRYVYKQRLYPDDPVRDDRAVRIYNLTRKLEARGYNKEQVNDLVLSLYGSRAKVSGVPNVTYPEPWRIRCLPYVYLAGVTKSGTTDLYDTMILHPDIVEPSMKEPMYFDRYRLHHQEKQVTNRPQRMPYPAWVNGRGRPAPYTTFPHYLDLFDHAAHEMELSLNGPSGYSEKITLDGTPCYLWDYDYWWRIPGNKGLDEPRYTLAHALAAVNPNARLVFILRDPVTRLFSHFKKARGGTPTLAEDFDQAVRNGIRLFQQCTSNRTTRACVYQISASNERTEGLYLRASLYSVFLADFLAVFPPGRVLIIRGEDYYSDRINSLNKVLHFLDMRRMPEDIVSVIREKEIANQGRVDMPFSNKTETILRDFFRPFNEELAKMLRDTSFLWNS